MYIVFTEDKLLRKVSFWSRHDIYEFNLFNDTKYLFPSDKKMLIDRVIDHLNMCNTTGYYINYTHHGLVEDVEENKNHLRKIIDDKKSFRLDTHSIMENSIYLIDLTLDIDYIMREINLSIFGGKFREYVRNEIIDKQITLRGLNIDQLLK